MLKKTLLLLLSLITIHSQARVHDFETTRLKSTGGAGVGSLLLEEAVSLNPASMGFYNVASLYFQKNFLNLSPIDNSRNLSSKNFQDKSSQLAFIATDAQRSTKGSVSYQKLKEAHEERKRLSVALASSMGEKTSLGFSYHYTDESLTFNGLNATSDIYHEFNTGLTQVLNEKTSWGLVIQDLLKRKSPDQKIYTGIQYSIDPMISIMLDVGAIYTRSFKNSLIYKTALQVSMLKDFFLRGGYFHDKSNGEKGIGTGIAWIAPKFSFELAYKVSEYLEGVSASYLSQNEKLKDLSLSMAIRF